MNRARFLIQAGTVYEPSFIAVDGYKQLLHWDNETYYFGVARSGRGWKCYELSSGIYCGWGTTRINAIDDCRRQLPKIVQALKESDKDPKSMLGQLRHYMAQYVKDSAESALR